MTDSASTPRPRPHEKPHEPGGVSPDQALEGPEDQNRSETSDRAQLVDSSPPGGTGWIGKLFGSRALALLWFGQVISQVGDEIFRIALIWLAYDLTGSRALSGVISSAAFLPMLVFGLLAGVVADRWPRKRTLIASDLIRAGLVCLLPILAFADALTPVTLVVMTLLVTSVSAFFPPSRDAWIPDLVPPAALPRANSLIQTSWQAAILLGPAIAAALLAALSVSGLFWIDAATFVLSALLIWRISVPSPAARTESSRRVFDPLARPRPSPLVDLWEGLRFVWRTRSIRLLIFVTAANNLFLMGPALLGIRLFVEDELGQGAEAFAWAQAALAGGILAGLPLMARYGHRLPLGTVLAIGLILDGLTYIPVALVTSLEWLVGVIFVHSFFIPLITASRTTLVQRLVPPEQRGRVFALVQVCVLGFTSLSLALTGLVTEVISLRTLFVAIGLLSAATAIPLLLSTSRRQMDQPDPKLAP